MVAQYEDGPEESLGFSELRDFSQRASQLIGTDSLFENYPDEGTFQELQYLALIGNIPPLINNIATPISSNVSHMSSLFWNLGSVLDYFAIYDSYKHLPEVKRHRKEKKALLAAETTIATVSNSASILTLLSQYGVLHGLAATACLPLAGIVASIEIWGIAIHSTVQLARAIKKTDPVYLFENKMIQYEQLSKRIVDLSNEEPIDAALLARLKEIRERVYNEAIAIVQVNFSTKVSFETPQKMKSLNESSSEEEKRIHGYIEKFYRLAFENEDSEKVKTLATQLCAPASNENKALVDQLIENQREKVTHHKIKTISNYIAAVGVTMMSVSLFCGPAAPIVLGLGIAITAVAGIIKLSQVIYDYASNKIAKNNRIKEETKNLLSKYYGTGVLTTVLNTIPVTGLTEPYIKKYQAALNGSDENKKAKTYEKLLKLKLSYEQAYPAGKQTKENETFWYENILKKDRRNVFQRLVSKIVTKKEMGPQYHGLRKAHKNKLLDNALTKKVDDMVLEKVFGSTPEAKKIIQGLTDKQKERIINRECRNPQTNCHNKDDAVEASINQTNTATAIVSPLQSQKIKNPSSTDTTSLIKGSGSSTSMPGNLFTESHKKMSRENMSNTSIPTEKPFTEKTGFKSLLTLALLGSEQDKKPNQAVSHSTQQGQAINRPSPTNTTSLTKDCSESPTSMLGSLFAEFTLPLLEKKKDEENDKNLRTPSSSFKKS